MNTHIADYSELKWRCRRGMLELDILLNSYLDKNYNTMTQQQGAVFSEVLDYPDQVLLDLLLGGMRSTDQSVNAVVESIRQATAC
jgi:antitoxin CptB